MNDDERAQAQAQAARHEAAIRRRQTIRLVSIGVLAAAFAGVALDNRQDVTVGWLFDEAQIPLIVALLASFVAGWVIGAFVSRRRSRPD